MMRVAADEKTAYQDLASHLDQAPLGAPDGPELIAILEALFSPAEAALAARLPFKPARIDRLAAEIGEEPGPMGETLASLARRGLVYERVTPGGGYYCLLPVVPGMLELQFMGGEDSPAKRELARLFEDYYLPGTGPAMTGAGMPYGRVIPVGRVVDNRQEILPHEEAAQVVKDAVTVALGTCYCRQEAELIGQGCGHPKDVCMIFGPFAEFAARMGWARLVEKEEALNALDRAEKAGLVHVTDNVSSGANFMCNCCGCCCLFLKTLSKMRTPGAVAAAGFLAEVDRAECTACGACVEACQVDAIRQDDDEPAVVDPDFCVGCGQCQSACAFGAIEMNRRPTAHPPAASHPELTAAILRARGLAAGGKGA